jgi:integration host factor subunit beta
MTKADLIDLILKKRDMTRVKAETVVNTVFESMGEALKRNERVEIRGFGTFEVRHYDAYKGRNPRTGDVIDVEEKRVPFFRVGKNLKRQVDGKTQSS